jgi:hypothetical protein
VGLWNASFLDQGDFVLKMLSTCWRLHQSTAPGGAESITIF